MKTIKSNHIFIILALIIFMSIGKIAQLFTDFWWFSSVGFENIFLITLKSKILLFFASAIIFFIFATINIWISSSKNNKKLNKNLLNKSPDIIPFGLKITIIGILSFFVGMFSQNSWFKILQYLNSTTFNIADPIFIKDVSFYIFSLPFFMLVWKFALITIILTILLVLMDYFPTIIKELFKQKPYTINGKDNIPTYNTNLKGLFSSVKRKSLVHLSLLSSLVLILVSINHYLARFGIMYSNKGIVVGAGYADVVAYLPIIKILMVLAIVITVLFLVWVFYISKSPKLKKRHILAYAFAIYLLFAFVGPTMIPGMVQQFIVTPNEINLEKPYIENNLEFTKIAYGLDDVEEKDYPANLGLTADIINDAKSTIDNARILDWRPLTQTYKQTQEIRLYYDLSEIDIDRYTIDGKYTQVMLSPRELDQKQITQNAQTWVNLHLVYTHGYGIVMSPVNSVTDQGLPNYLIQDIPPRKTVADKTLEVTRPEIYYGEIDNDFILVNTNADEFDYPKGDSNAYINYNGTGGVVLDSFFKKVMMAIRFTDIRILLSSDIIPTSKILFDRNIIDRISKITPFLALDSDPYTVLDNGKIYWIQDAYTLSGNFPYSQKIGNINYIRNSVKIVVDAYDGNVNYYVMPGDEAIIETYSKIFPGEFQTFDEMPAGLKEHIRYPVDLFKVQSEIYNTYHMNDASIFYNKEDAWEIPNEVYGTGQQVKVEPYYIIMKLPDEEKEEFILMTSFTPIKKNNMIAWLAARNDGENYGKLLLYKFPKDKLIFGPLQIEAKFDQDSDISEQLTLWSQQGSRVTRGNLLVIPIKDSILYIEPLYLQAETGQLPELKRILVSDGEKVVMERTLADALEALFGTAKTRVINKETGIEAVETPTELIEKANKLYEKILESMKNQDWEGIGDNLDALGETLQQLE